MNITYGSNFRVKKDINYKILVSIEAGLARTISWYKLFKFKKILKLNNEIRKNNYILSII